MPTAVSNKANPANALSKMELKRCDPTDRASISSIVLILAVGTSGSTACTFAATACDTDKGSTDVRTTSDIHKKGLW